MDNFSILGLGVKTAAARERERFSWLDSGGSVFHFGFVDCWLRVEAMDTPRIPLSVFQEVVASLMDIEIQLNEEQPSSVIGIAPMNQLLLAKARGQNETIQKI